MESFEYTLNIAGIFMSVTGFIFVTKGLLGLLHSCQNEDYSERQSVIRSVSLGLVALLNSLILRNLFSAEKALIVKVIVAILIFLLVLFLSFLTIRFFYKKKKDKEFEIQKEEKLKNQLISLNTNLTIENIEIKSVLKSIIAIVSDIRKMLNYQTISDSEKTKVGRETELIVGELESILLLYSKIEEYAHSDNFFDEETFLNKLNYFYNHLGKMKDEILETDKLNLEVNVEVLENYFPETLDIKSTKKQKDIRNKKFNK